MTHNFAMKTSRCMLLALLLAAASFAAAAAYPEKPVKLVVPYPPGGLTDAVARQVAGALAERLKQPVVIENIAGGGGNIGAERAARSAADGYTLYLGNNATVGINTLIYKKLGFDPVKDLAPVSLLAESQTVLVVHPSVAANSVAELIALAKAKPGALNFGSTGQGGLSHLVGELFKTNAGIQMTHVPYKGTGPALNDLLGGQIQLMFNDTAVPHVKAGKLRALAATGTKRWRDLPDTPTMGELGFAGYETYNWFGLLVPAGTPGAVIAHLNRETVASMKEPAMQAWMQSRGAEAVSSSPEEFAAYIRKDLEKWARVVKAVGLTPE
jgi:tripartite-type tricarboxylate transporter receptor subunit TctC